MCLNGYEYIYTCMDVYLSENNNSTGKYPYLNHTKNI